METEKGAKEVNGKGRRERSEGCICKRGVDGRKRGRGKCHGLQNLRNGDRQKRLGKKGLEGGGGGGGGGRKENSKSKRQGAKAHKAREQGKKKAERGKRYSSRAKGQQNRGKGQVVRGKG